MKKEKSFAVKHINKDMGPLTKLYKDIKRQPFSFTSKKHEAYEAAKGNFIFVIEVIREKNITKYYLGYKYRATDCLLPPKRTLWRNQFEYKNTVKYGNSSDGMYFDIPILIEDIDFIEWYKGQTLGMVQIPEKYIEVLDSIFLLSGTKPHPFKY